MLENINLGRKLPREEYKSALPALQERLYDLEKACWDQNVPTIIAFEGWDASGKGTAIGALTQRHIVSNLSPIACTFGAPGHIAGYEGYTRHAHGALILQITFVCRFIFRR